MIGAGFIVNTEPKLTKKIGSNRWSAAPPKKSPKLGLETTPYSSKLKLCKMVGTWLIVNTEPKLTKNFGSNRWSVAPKNPLNWALKPPHIHQS